MNHLSKAEREKWEKPCGYCDQQSCTTCKNLGEADYVFPCSDCSPSGRCGKSYYEPSDFCRYCGRPLTEKAWAELEKRLRG